MARKLKCKVVHGRPRHPQSQGVVERVNQTIKSKIKNDSPWSDQIPEITRIYNNTFHSTTGFSPNQIEGKLSDHSNSRLSILSCDQLPLNVIHDRAKLNIEKNANRMKKYYKNLLRTVQSWGSNFGQASFYYQI